MYTAVFLRYLRLLGDSLPLVVGVFACGFFCLILWDRYGQAVRRSLGDLALQRLFPLVVCTVAVGLGLALALGKASVVDDAFISMRYARNLAEGNGLVFNLGQRVEGYTNFLWTLIFGLFALATDLDLPFVALVLSLLCFVATLVATFFCGRALVGSAEGRLYLPLAVVLLALSRSFTEFATTGMETMAGALCLTVIGYLFVRTRKGNEPLLIGIVGITATLLRPDLSIFYVCSGLTIVLEQLRAVRKSDQGLRGGWPGMLKAIGQFSAPFVVYLGYLVWKYFYYGDILPNTFYAKEAHTSHFGLGAFYDLTFVLANHFWVPLTLWCVWLVFKGSNERERSLKVFALSSVVLYSLYVTWVGGDFMCGRFFVPLMPLVLVGAEGAVYRLARERSQTVGRIGKIALLVPVCLLLAFAGGTRIIGPSLIRWGIANEGEVYKVKRFYPIEVNHANYWIGKNLYNWLYARGERPVIATSGIGMVAYYSRLELVDIIGLTDRDLARVQSRRLGRIGHGIKASASYLRQQGVVFARTPIATPVKFRKITKIVFGPQSGSKPWHILYFDKAFMDRLKQAAPQVRFQPFDEFLDWYLKRIKSKNRQVVARELEWFKIHYFDHNQDPERLDAFRRYLRYDTPAPGRGFKPTSPRGQPIEPP